jgi:NADH dehydrogenase
MPVLVTGATGCVGRALIPKLVDSGGQVRVYVRRDVPEYRELGVHVAIGEADHEGRLESALEQVHTLVHLTGGPVPEPKVTMEWLNVDATEVAVRAAENAGVRRVLFLSHIGADPGSDHPYLAAKGRAEQALTHTRAFEHVIFRCAPILAQGSALSFALERGLSSGGRMNPIAVEDVAGMLVAADTRDAELRGAWELGGPETMTVAELSARSGARGRAVSRVMRGVPKELSTLYGRDLVADPSQAVALFGLEPSKLS